MSWATNYCIWLSSQTGTALMVNFLCFSAPKSSMLWILVSIRIPPWSLSPYLCSSTFYFLFHKSRTDVMPMVRWMPVTSLVMAHAFCVSLWSPYVSLKWHKSGDFRIGTHSMMVTKPTTLECISVSRKHWATQRQMQSHVNTGLRSVAKVRGCHLACLLHCQQQKQWRNAPSLCCPPIQPKIWLSRQQSQNRKKAGHTGIMICY